MPSASSFINKIRAGSEGRNTKVEYKGGVTQTNSLSAIGCSQINRWVDTEYQEKSIITCNDSNPKVSITKAFAAIDNNTGLVNVSWKTSSHSNSYVILYKSDGTLIETKETDGYTRIITFSILLTSGSSSYYATITSAGSSETTNSSGQFIYKYPISIGVLATDAIPYSSTNPYISASSTTITTSFFSSYPTLVQIEYYYNLTNTSENGVLSNKFTADTSITNSHSYTVNQSGYYYSVITPINKHTSFITSNTALVSETLTNIIFTRLNIVLYGSFIADIDCYLTIYFYGSSTAEGDKTLLKIYDKKFFNKGNNFYYYYTEDFLNQVQYSYYHLSIVGLTNTYSRRLPV